MPWNLLEALNMLPAFSGWLLALHLADGAQQNFKHKLLPQFLGESHQTLQAFWPSKQCVIRWFSFTSVHFSGGFLCKSPLSVRRISLWYPGIHALLRNLKWRHCVILAFSKRGSIQLIPHCNQQYNNMSVWAWHKKRSIYSNRAVSYSNRHLSWVFSLQSFFGPSV